MGSSLLTPGDWMQSCTGSLGKDYSFHFYIIISTIYKHSRRPPLSYFSSQQSTLLLLVITTSMRVVSLVSTTTSPQSLEFLLPKFNQSSVVCRVGFLLYQYVDRGTHRHLDFTGIHNFWCGRLSFVVNIRLIATPKRVPTSVNCFYDD